MFFVAFSSARGSEGVYLTSFNPSYIKCDDAVTKELNRLETKAKYKLSQTYHYDQYFLDLSTHASSSEIKTTYLNRNGLLHSNHFQCLSNDKNMLTSNVIFIAETKLTVNDSQDSIKLEEQNILKNF